MLITMVISLLADLVKPWACLLEGKYYLAVLVPEPYSNSHHQL